MSTFSNEKLTSSSRLRFSKKRGVQTLLSYRHHVLAFLKMTLTKKVLLFTIGSLLFVASFMLLARSPTFDPANYFSLLNRTTVETTRANSENIKSKCSIKADGRGAHQKVMAFSVSAKGSSPTITWNYIKLLKERITEFSSLYPGWVLRIYHDLPPDDDTLNWFILNDYFGPATNVSSYVDLCYFGNAINITMRRDYNHLVWRFLPLLDDYVDIFVSRDVTSFITRRETEAVGEWLESNRTFHIMRDHPIQCDSIISGLWGAKLSSQRSKIRQAARKLFKIRHRLKESFDKSILKEYLWPLIRLDAMVHDSYCCDNVFDWQLGKRSITKAFPVERLGNEFAGKPQTWNNNSSPFECPRECRPPENPEWKFC